MTAVIMPSPSYGRDTGAPFATKLPGPLWYSVPTRSLGSAPSTASTAPALSAVAPCHPRFHAARSYGTPSTAAPSPPAPAATSARDASVVVSSGGAVSTAPSGRRLGRSPAPDETGFRNAALARSVSSAATRRGRRIRAKVKVVVSRVGTDGPGLL